MSVKEQILTEIAQSLSASTAARELAKALPEDSLPPPPPPQPTPTETVFHVKAGDNLQAAIAAAAADTSGKDVRLLLAPRTQFKVNIDTPVKKHTHGVFIEPDWDSNANLGTGLVSRDNPDLPQVVPASTTSAVLRNVASSGWYWRGVHFAPTGSGRSQIELGDPYATTPGAVAGNLDFTQCRMVGDPVNYQKRAMATNCGALVVRNSAMWNIGFPGEDGQCICGWNGPGPFTIIGNYLEGAAENILFGGGRVSGEPMVPSDIVVRGNWFRKNPDWLTAAVKPSVKNLLELKNAQRVLIEANLFENNWTAGQVGGAILFKAAANSEPIALARCHHVVFRYNVVRNAGGFLTINNSEGVGTTLGCNDIEVSHNVAYALATGTWTGDGHGFRFGGGPDNIRLLHNTMINKHTFLYLWDNPAIHKVSNLQVIGNLAREASYGVFGSNVPGQGIPTLDAYAPGYVWQSNAFEEGSSIAKYPAGHVMLPSGLLTGAGLDAQMRPVDPRILAVKDAQGVVVGADIAKILQAFGQFGIKW